MKAIVYTEYGPPEHVVRMTDVPKPEPKDDEVLIRVRAASVNALDWRIMLGRPLIVRPMVGGLRRPRITRPGVDVAGEVEAVGGNAGGFRPGDAVFGACRGAFAEYACTTADRLVHKPGNVSFEQAAAVPVAAITALQGLRDQGRIRAGQRVLIDGASGGVGTFAVSIAKALGAEVTAVCSSGNVAAARTLGADLVIDYTREDFVRSGLRYDLVFAANAHRSLFDYLRVLVPDGRFVLAGGGLPQIFQAFALAPLLSLVSRKRLLNYVARINQADLQVLDGLLAEGKLTPVMDRHYPLDETAEAIRHVAAGHARGKVIVTV